MGDSEVSCTVQPCAATTSQSTLPHSATGALDTPAEQTQADAGSRTAHADNLRRPLPSKQRPALPPATLQRRPWYVPLTKVPDTQLRGQATPSIRIMVTPGFVDDPGEAHYWFRMLANSPTQAAQDIALWQRMPLYSQYIMHKNFKEIVEDSMAHSRLCRCLEVTLEDANRHDHNMGRFTLLPIDVMATFLHQGCCLPIIFAFDLF